ncbi:hypothetical protein CDV31_001308 [Fusarium ambrosium]|uniref:Major facilitator superfamily (MFS) profile domain-containing protein n=1 Tax=Fusarium ambrosium TaxID=131363 RepID=A0A428V068_9HYPO|nr:hypothetical protein CDV31_001308 [Fusarium ambrosium]
MTATTNDTESSPLLPAERDGYGSASDCESAPQPEEPKPYSHAFIARVVIALLIGVFTANADGSLVLATHPVIASEFGDLADSSWLFISFMLAGAASQTVYGKLSDIFGRKAILMFCYGLFALGCALVGIGQSMWQVILGRVISGSGSAGMTAMASVIITATPLEIGGQKIPWSHPLIFALFATGLVLAVAFVFVESRWAKEPIYPLRLLRNAQVTKSYLIVAAQAGAQLGRVSSTIAGAHLFPAVIGNTIGGIAAGIIINRTGRYKALLVFAATSSITGYTLMLLRWHGHTSWAESLYVFPGGLGTGIAFSAGFISLQASIDPKDKASAAAGLFMTSTLGIIIGMAGTSAIIQGYLRYSVQLDLARLGMSQAEIAENATGAVQKVLINGYVKGIEYGHGLSIVFAGITLITASLLKERKL